jgi:hypothetical protein
MKYRSYFLWLGDEDDDCTGRLSTNTSSVKIVSQSRLDVKPCLLCYNKPLPCRGDSEYRSLRCSVWAF